MTRKPAAKPPTYRLHRSSGQAITTLVDAVTGRRRDHLLGPHGTPKSRAKYHTLIGQWEAAGRRLGAPEVSAPTSGGVSVRAMSRAYLAHVRPLYDKSHFIKIDRSLGLLCAEHGDTSAAKLGPRKLKGIRTAMIGMGWKRETVNKCVRLIVAAARWAASEELVPAEVHAAMATVPNLKRGEQGVEDGGSVKPAPLPHIDAARPHLPSQIITMIDLQLLTGMRPGEVVIMRRCDIEAVDKVHLYRPGTHKNAHRGIEREVLLGPRAMALLEPFLDGLKFDGHLFSPRRANAERKAKDAKVRRRPNQIPTPVATDRSIGDHYTPGSYRRAIHRACDAAGVPRWSPNQLRHNAATELRRDHGLEKAALLLGHSEATVTAKHYAERDRGTLADIVAKIG